MIERIKNNWVTKLVAFGLASLLWLYVNVQANPQLEDVYSNVPVEVTGLAQDLALITKPPAVQVRVSGSRTNLATVGQRDIRAYIDLSGAVPGSNLAPINVVTPGNIEVVSILPAQVNVTVDRIVEEKRGVAVNIVGELAAGFVYGEPELRPDFIFLQGASQVLNEIKEVFVTVELDQEMKEDLVLQLPVKVVSQVDMPLTTSVRLNPQWVEVTLPLREQAISKAVPLKAAFTGEPANGFQVTSVMIEPEEIVVTGPAAVLAGLEEILLAEVSLEGINETLVIARAPVLPDQATALEVEMVQVTVIVKETGRGEN